METKQLLFNKEYDSKIIDVLKDFSDTDYVYCNNRYCVSGRYKKSILIVDAVLDDKILDKKIRIASCGNVDLTQYRADSGVFKDHRKYGDDIFSALKKYLSVSNANFSNVIYGLEFDKPHLSRIKKLQELTKNSYLFCDRETANIKLNLIGEINAELIVFPKITYL